jgi:membrane protease YdiL (CAAX protease family)
MSDTGADRGERLAPLLCAAALLLAYHYLYDSWKLPPQVVSFGPFPRAWIGDVVPLVLGPILWLRAVQRAPLGEYGFRLRPLRRAAAAAVLAYAAMLPVALWLALHPGVERFYPSTAFPPARASGAGLAILWVLGHAPQLFAAECFWRGFALFPLARRVGAGAALGALVPLYALLHLGKPAPELLLALWGGVVLSVAALRTRSFLPAFAAHWLVAVTVDALCYARLHGAP